MDTHVPLTLKLFKTQTIMVLHDIDILVENNIITKNQAWGIIKTFLIKSTMETNGKNNLDI